MGTFAGHALPGSFFIVFSFWWIYHIFRRYFHSLRNPTNKFRSTVTFPCFCLCGKLRSWEVEGFIKIFFSTVGFFLEIYTAYYHGKFKHYGNGQHATMFFFFWLSGLVDILVHHRFTLPKGIEYVMMTMAFSVEGLLFKFHLHGRNELDVLIHTFLLYSVYGSIVASLLEMRFRNNVLCVLTRTLFMLLQGTWFWQLAFILYNPISGATKWQEDDHNEMMLATMMFTWHIGVDFIIVMVIGLLMGCFYRVRDGSFHSKSYDSLKMHLVKKDANGHTVVNLNDDSDSDIEYERPLNSEG